MFVRPENWTFENMKLCISQLRLRPSLPYPGNCRALAHLVSPKDAALANLARPGGRALANPRGTAEKYVDVVS